MDGAHALHGVGGRRMTRSAPRNALSLGVLAALLAVPVHARAQGRRGEVVVLGLRAPDGDDDAATNATLALRRATRTLGFDTPSESPALDQLVAAFGCDDSVPLACVEQITADLHVPRILYGSIRRVGVGRDAPLRIELTDYNQATHTLGATHTADLARAVSQDSDAIGPTVRHLLDEIYPSPNAPPPVATPPVSLPPVTAPGLPVANPPSGVLPPISSSAMGRPERVIPVDREHPVATTPGPSWQRIAGSTAVGVGGAMVIVGAAYAIVWSRFASDQQSMQSPWAQYQPFAADDSRTHDTGALCSAARTQTPNAAGQGPTPAFGDVTRVCDTHAAYQGIEWGFFGAGIAVLGAGVVLLLIDPPRTAPPPAYTEHRVQPIVPTFAFAPVFTPGYQGATGVLRF